MSEIDKNLIENLENILKLLKENNLPQPVKDRLQEFVNGSPVSSREIEKYLFIGWYVTQMFESMSERGG